MEFNENIYNDNQDSNDWKRQCNTAEQIIAQFKCNHKTMILADEVGMGKTYSALATMAQFINKRKKVLLIVPAGGVLENKWLEEIENFNKIYLNRDATKIKAIVTDDLRYGILLASTNKKEYKNLTEKRKKYFIQVIKNWINKNKKKLAIENNIKFRKDSRLWHTFYKEFPPQKIDDFLTDCFIIKNKKININELTEDCDTVKELFFKFIKFFSKKNSSYNLIITKMRTIRDSNDEKKEKILKEIENNIKNRL